ncbi:MAG: alkaline phosphatase [Betaproteobacteria bacterium]|nr:alkaline phosphatase [Betaproteobacteria bacterium]
MKDENAAPNPLRRILVAALAGFALALAGCASTGSSTPAAAQAPKNIIILFADGAAPTQWEFGRYASEHLRKQSFAVTDVVFRKGVLGLLSTHSANSMVTDSAASATAMSTGFKTNNFMVGVTPEGRPLTTFYEAAKAAGKRLGLVTTAAIYDASPAAFSVHSANRGEFQRIVDQYFTLEPDVLLGGGAGYFLPAGSPGGKRKDGRDVIAAFAGKGYRVARNTVELNAAGSARLLGLFADGPMGYEIDSDPARTPSIADMTRAALRVLSRSGSNGFVLFAENENTDDAAHENDIAALMRALWAFDDAVNVALEFQQRNPDTLVIVTSDHETGGLSVTYALRNLNQQPRQTRIYAQPHLEAIGRITMSLGAVASKLGREPSPEALDALLLQHFPGFRLDDDLREHILKQRPLELNFTNNTQNALGRMIARQTGFYWGTAGHTSEPVAVGAIGPGAELFRGYQDNTDFGRHLHRLIQGK